MKKSVSINKGEINIAANIFFPKDFNEGGNYPAIICVHPGSGVKEQTAGLYAQKVSQKGYISIAFDASFQGDSGGEPRFLEDPYRRVEDIRSVVDYLMTLKFIDTKRIGALGICAGGGYTVSAALTDHRIKAIGLVVPINIGEAYRKFGGSRKANIELLTNVGEQRSLEARGEDLMTVPWTPSDKGELSSAGITDIDICEAVDYYRTERGYHPNSPNKLLFRSIGQIMGFDAFHLVEDLLSQPVQIIAGTKVGSYGSKESAENLYNRIQGKKDILYLEGASHFDLYDNSFYVDKAVDKIITFYKESL